jgi:hypothetical protein
MNSTEKMEMQVEELQDGGASVELPEGVDNPQQVADDQDDDNNENDGDEDKYDLWSPGRDKQEGTADDINSWKSDEASGSGSGSSGSGGGSTTGAN